VRQALIDEAVSENRGCQRKWHMRCNGPAAEQRDEAAPSGDTLHYKVTQKHTSAFEGLGVASDEIDERWSIAGFEAGKSDGEGWLRYGI
jgi:hypothetical protein